MKLGICLEKGGFHYAVVSGEKLNPHIIDRGKRGNPEPESYPNSAKWFKNAFGQILRDNKIDKVVIKLHYKLLNMDAMLIHGLPIGLISLCCSEKNIPLATISKAKLKGYSVYGLPKGTKALEWVDTLKDDQPYWTESCKTAILAGITAL